MTATSFPLDGLRHEKKRKRTRKQVVPNQPVHLSFDTQRIFASKQARPVGQIMFDASELEQLSFQPTVRLEFKHFSPELQKGMTQMNKVGKKDFFRTQAFTLVTISGMGLLIGFFIAYFI